MPLQRPNSPKAWPGMNTWKGWNGMERQNSFGMATLPETNSKRPWKWMVGSLVSFWDGLFSGAFAVSFRECKALMYLSGIVG